MAIDGKRVLVTGCNGFIGQNLVTRLLQRCCHVIGIDRNHKRRDTCASYQPIETDLTSSLEHVSEAIQEVEYVFHLAALTRTRRSRDLIGVNRTMLTNLLDACSQNAHLKKMIYVSSVAAAGPQKGDKPLRESDAVHPVSNYGQSKSSCEQKLVEVSDFVPVSIVRPPIVLGRGDTTALKIFRFIQKTGLHLSVNSRQKIGVVHIDDLVMALMMVARNGQVIARERKDNGLYYVATQDAIDYAELGRRIGKALDINVRVLGVPRTMLKIMGFLNDIFCPLLGRNTAFLNSDKIRDALSGSWAVDSTKIRQELGFVPSRNLDTRIEETANWYREHQWIK